MVANGMGVAVLCDMVYRPWALEGRREEIVSVSDAVPSMEVGFDWSNSVQKNVAVDAFREFMRLAIGNDQSYR
jgi:DNA-binding transcriptional LysR family regulator